MILNVEDPLVLAVRFMSEVHQIDLDTFQDTVNSNWFEWSTGSVVTLKETALATLE